MPWTQEGRFVLVSLVKKHFGGRIADMEMSQEFFFKNQGTRKNLMFAAICPSATAFLRTFLASWQIHTMRKKQTAEDVE